MVPVPSTWLPNFPSCCSIFVEIILRHSYYLIYTCSYVEDLKNKRDTLVGRKNDLIVDIEEAEKKSERPTNDMDVWIKHVDDILCKIDKAVEAYEARNCLCTICSNYKSGLRCDNMMKEVDRLLHEGSVYRKAKMTDLDNSKAPIAMPYVVPESLEKNFKDVVEHIEDGNSNIISIRGMGGVGKTTLLKKVRNSFTSTPKFSHVIWTVASSEQSNVSRIQSEIIKTLKLTSGENDDVQSKAQVIYNFLKDKNFLLFIDNLWEAVDLYEVGVPNLCEEGCGKNRKVVFTTRSLDVCGKMGAKKIVEVKCLDEAQSWVLFKEKVGEQAIQSHTCISGLAKDVAKECKGLPLALITIGNAMCTNSNPGDWKNTLNLMKKSQSRDIWDTSLLSVLKISYDLLPSEDLRKCFLSISLWPKGDSISKMELIECWMGLDIIDKYENIDEAYKKGHSLIGRLLAASLLEEDDLNIIGHECVKMHDVLREMALWIGSDKWLVKAGIKLQEAPSIGVKWSEVEYISLLSNRIKKLPSSIPSCPRLLTLMLQQNLLICESILNSFRNFKSLKYLDLSYNKLASFPESICDLPALQYLNLSYNEIEDIPKKLGNLKELKYLLLQSNWIRNVPRGVLAGLVKLLVLDLTCFKYSVKKSLLVNIEELKRLEKKLLYLGTDVFGEEEFTKLLNVSGLSIIVLRILKLPITSFSFMSIIPNPYILSRLVIEDCSLMEIIFEENEIQQSVNLVSLQLSDLCRLERIIWEGIEPKNLFTELQKINITGCNLIDDITWIIHLPSLTYFSINACDNMRIAIKNEDNINEVEPNISTFPSLRNLEFLGMQNMEKISTHSLAFPELYRLTVIDCPLLKTLPIAVKSAPKLLMIFGSEEWWDELEWGDDDSRSHFSQLVRVSKRCDEG